MKKSKIKSEEGNRSKENIKKSKRQTPRWLVGIDEVGRGPLAGPVTVGAVAVLCDGSNAQAYSNLRKKLMENSGKINGGIYVGVGKEYPIGVDSKKMKEDERNFWYEVVLKLIKSGDLYAVVGNYSARMIDKRGIAVCIKDLVDGNLKKLSKKIKTGGGTKSVSLVSPVPFDQMDVLLDGGLKTSLDVYSQKTIIKGDEKELLISLASVFAKVTRDTHMKKLSKNPEYAIYGFEIHKGYGTLKHRQAIKIKGLSDEHRVSFCGNFLPKIEK